MNDKLWMLAKLTDKQLEMVKEAEQALGSIHVLALQPVDSKVANLNESQIECLQGVEKALGLTVVAYRSG